MPDTNFNLAHFLNRQIDLLVESVSHLQAQTRESDIVRECELLAKFSSDLFSSLHELDLHRTLQLLDGDRKRPAIDDVVLMYESWLSPTLILADLANEELSQTRDYSTRFLGELPALINECRWMLTPTSELFCVPAFEGLRTHAESELGQISAVHSTSSHSRLALTSRVKDAVATFPVRFRWRNLAEATIQNFCKDFNAPRWDIQKFVSHTSSQILTMNITHRYRVLMFKQKQDMTWYWLGDFESYQQTVGVELT